MPASKLASPFVPSDDHPAHQLEIGNDDEIQTLMKLTPVTLPNDTIVENLQKQYPDDQRWFLFRKDYKYIYVMQWMFQCRGYVKLILEHFDPDLFEIELFNLVDPPPIDDLVLLSNKVRLALMNKFVDKKLTRLVDFEPAFRKLFGPDTPLKGVKDESDDENDVDASYDSLPQFDDLFIDEKFEVLYLLMARVSLKSDFRDFIDKNGLLPDLLRPEFIFHTREGKSGKSEEYFLAFDSTALFKRTVNPVELHVEKKRKLAPISPEEALSADVFDSTDIQYDLLFRGIYQLNSLIKELHPRRKIKKNKALLDIISTDDFITNVFAYDIKKRRVLQNRRKESKMAHLLATRKKSLRLEAKERQKEEEEHERRLREFEEAQLLPNRRSKRTRNMMETKLKQDFTAGLSREERLKMRKAASQAPLEHGADTPSSDHEVTLLKEEENTGEPSEVSEDKDNQAHENDTEEPIEVLEDKDVHEEPSSLPQADASSQVNETLQENLATNESSDQPQSVTQETNGQVESHAGPNDGSQ